MENFPGLVYTKLFFVLEKVMPAPFVFIKSIHLLMVRSLTLNFPANSFLVPVFPTEIK